MSEIKSFGKYFNSRNILEPSEYIECWSGNPKVAPAMLFYYGVNHLALDKHDLQPLWVDVQN